MPLRGTLAAGSALGFGAGSGVSPTCFICATGGTITDCGDYRTHVFTGDDSFVMNAPVKTACNAKIDYIVVAGGGASGGGNYAGGGGGGGYRESKNATFPATGSPLASATSLCVQEGGSFPIQVGGGGG